MGLIPGSNQTQIVHIASLLGTQYSGFSVGPRGLDHQMISGCSTTAVHHSLRYGCVKCGGEISHSSRGDNQRNFNFVNLRKLWVFVSTRRHIVMALVLWSCVIIVSQHTWSEQVFMKDTLQGSCVSHIRKCPIICSLSREAEQEINSELQRVVETRLFVAT